MDTLLMREEPLFRKCCYVIPLSFCLHTWAFLKLAGDLLAIYYTTLFIVEVYRYEGSFHAIYILVLQVVALVIDVGFLIALIAGIFEKSIAVIRVFYFYELYFIVVELSFLIFISVKIAEGEIKAGSQGIIFMTVGIIVILLDLCIIVTLKSEMVKLRNKNQYDFSRMSLECEETGNSRSDV